jgi:hypothetical protein
MYAAATARLGEPPAGSPLKEASKRGRGPLSAPLIRSSQREEWIRDRVFVLLGEMELALLLKTVPE